MPDLRPALFIVGVLLAMLAVAMAAPALVDLALGSQDRVVFAVSGAATLCVGLTLSLSTRSSATALTIRQAFLMTTLAWVILPAFGGLPLFLSGIGLSVTDAVFESVSAFTTTGATVITSLDTTAPGILLWRSLLQGMGGLGIIVVGLSVLPMLQIGGMQLFRMEFTDQAEKILPRAAQIGAGLTALYLLLIAVCTFCYWLAGMSLFDAVNHALSTLSTGGLSTRDASLGGYANPALEWISIVFMIAGSLPFLVCLQAFRFGARHLYRDNQTLWFLIILGSAIGLITASLLEGRGMPFGDAIRAAAFNTTSIMTTTGFTSGDYGQWGAFAQILLLLLMFCGGCAGSTTGGIKVFRIQVLFTTARTQLQQLLKPHGIFIAHYNRKALSEPVVDAVMGFFFLFLITYAVLVAALAAVGLDFISAVSGAAATLFNVGPGMGDVIGPSGNYASLPDAAKWLMAAGMLMGRLEVLSVLVLFSPSFWRR